jgi:hypothetical protein
MSPLVLLMIGGFAALAYFVYDWLQYRLRLRMRRESKEGRFARKVSYDWKVYAIFIFAVFLAFLYARPIERVLPDQPPPDPFAETITVETETKHAYVVAIYVLAVGIWWGMRQASREKTSERMLISLQVAELVHSFRSVFRIRPTVFSALEEANRKIPPPVGSAVLHAVTTFYVTSLPRRALDELRIRIGNPYLEQFIYILERGEDAKHEDIMLALDGLLHRLRRAREIRDKSEVNMTVITGQTKMIQLIAVTLVTVVAVIPLFREAYEGTIGQIVFVIIASIGVLTSWYIDRQATALKEKVL